MWIKGYHFYFFDEHLYLVMVTSIHLNVFNYKYQIKSFSLQKRRNFTHEEVEERPLYTNTAKTSQS